MLRKKQHIDTRIKDANINTPVVVLLTGNGKGKSSSALGMIVRALGWGQKVVWVSFLKGEMQTGEKLFFENTKNLIQVEMQSGFTWDTQNKELDIQNATQTWNTAKGYLDDDSIDLIVFDEITYMFNYGYLEEEVIMDAITSRASTQNVVITGRAASDSLMSIADTISEVKDIKHAFNNNIAAQKGVDL